MRRDFEHTYLPTGLLWIGTTYGLKIAGYPWNELKEKRDETMQEHSTHRRMIDQSPETPNFMNQQPYDSCQEERWGPLAH